jgi:hypothetical protein
MAIGIPLIGLKMAKPVRNSLGPLLLHHGCVRFLANLVLEEKTSPNPNENKYDWLGPGIYFWVCSPRRGQQQRNPPPVLPSLPLAPMQPAVIPPRPQQAKRPEKSHWHRSWAIAIHDRNAAPIRPRTDVEP